jgi:phytanoyl-CoA hydroxylase
MNEKITESEVGFYRENGYVLVKGVFDAGAVDKIKEELAGLAALEKELEPGSLIYEDNHEEIRKHSDNPLDWIRKVDYPAMSQSAYLMDIFRSGGSDIARICARLIGERRLRLIFLSTFAKPPRSGSEIPWHQDQALWDLWMRNGISGWAALSKTTDENGVLQIVPKSHTWGIVQHRQYPGKIHESINLADYPQARPVKIYMDPGDVVFFGGRTFHFSEPNHSDQRRLGMPVVYTGENDLQEGLACSEWVETKTQPEVKVAPLPMSADRRKWYSNQPALEVHNGA